MFGGGVAAGTLIGINYLRLGRRVAAGICFAIGCLVHFTVGLSLTEFTSEAVAASGLQLAFATTAGVIALRLFHAHRKSHRPFAAVRTIRVGWICFALLLSLRIHAA